MTQTFRSLTPPKYAATLEERKAVVLLEDRLKHFIAWLRETKQVELVLWTDSSSRRLTFDEMDSAVEEYVNE